MQIKIWNHVYILFLKQIKFFRLDPWRNKIIMVGRINGVYIGSLEHSGFRSEYVLRDLDYVENNCVDYRSSIYFFLFLKFLNFARFDSNRLIH